MATTNATLNGTTPMQWGAIFMGTVIALAISLVLMQFGAAVGLTDDAPLRGAETFTSWGVIAMGIWLLWVQLLASLAGGYIAGYLRLPSANLKPHENETRDGMYGLTVWATATVLVFIAVSVGAFWGKLIEVQSETYVVADTLTTNEQNAAIIFAFILGATSLLSAVAAWWAGTMGGEHQIKSVNFSKELSFKR